MSTPQPELHHQDELSAGLAGTSASRFVQPPPKRPTALRPAKLPVPTIDLSLLSTSPTEVAKLDAALRERGLFHAVNHGVPSPLIDRLLSTTREFFATAPPQQPGDSYGHDAVVGDDQILDWNHRVLIMVEPASDRKEHLWPPLLKDVLWEYHQSCKLVAEKVHMAMGEALGLGRDYFRDVYGEEGDVQMRFNHYPRCERPDLVMGLKPHRDISTITMLLQDPEVEGGLQVVDKEGKWVEVPVLPGALLISAGDQMEIISNGAYRSNMHRVVTAAEKERVSVAFFYVNVKEKVIGPAKALVGEGRPRVYKDVKADDYVHAFWLAFPNWKTVIDSVKIDPEVPPAD